MTIVDFNLQQVELDQLSSSMVGVEFCSSMLYSKSSANMVTKLFLSKMIISMLAS